MNFDEATQYLYGLGNEVTAMKLGLENITKLLAALGNPQNDYLKIQIAGTNGKGSTVAFLESICVAAGINVGATTSPHLISITERVRIKGAEISEKDFARLATKVRETSEKLVENFNAQSSEQSKIGLETVPTYFEQVTAIALTAFAEAKIELAILETGLGGRFDATTAAHAEIVAITPIDFDHQDILGNSLQKIAAEKAAIIRADTRVVISDQKSEALEVLLGRCKETNAAPVFNECEFAVETQEKCFFWTTRCLYQVAALGLKGEHQRQNACTAINLAEVLIKDFRFEISDSAIIGGLENARHAGRLEWKKIRGVNFLFDGAHNASGAKALREYLDEFIKQPITMIFGAMRDKDLTEITAILFPKADKLILTAPNNPRSMETNELLKFVQNDFAGEVRQFDLVGEALEKAREISSEKNLILITGSLYLVGEAQKILKNEFDI